MGANIGFQWIAGSNFASNQPVKLTSNTIIGGATGVLVQSQGLATLSFNRIVGNRVTGINNVDGTATAENNWWGCNAGPGNTGCDTVTGAADFNPRLAASSQRCAWRDTSQRHIKRHSRHDAITQTRWTHRPRAACR